MPSTSSRVSYPISTIAACFRVHSRRGRHDLAWLEGAVYVPRPIDSHDPLLSAYFIVLSRLRPSCLRRLAPTPERPEEVLCRARLARLTQGGSCTHTKEKDDDKLAILSEFLLLNPEETASFVQCVFISAYQPIQQTEGPSSVVLSLRYSGKLWAGCNEQETSAIAHHAHRGSGSPCTLRWSSRSPRQRVLARLEPWAQRRHSAGTAKDFSNGKRQHSILQTFPCSI